MTASQASLTKQSTTIFFSNNSHHGQLFPIPIAMSEEQTKSNEWLKCNSYNNKNVKKNQLKKKINKKKKEKKRKKKIKKKKREKLPIIVKRLCEFKFISLGCTVSAIGFIAEGENVLTSPQSSCEIDEQSEVWRTLPRLSTDQERFRLAKDGNDIIIQMPLVQEENDSSQQVWLPSNEKLKITGTLDILTVPLEELCIKQEIKQQILLNNNATTVPIFVIHMNTWEKIK